MNKDSVVIVTGANSGIGKATAFALSYTGAKIVMVCRNAERGEKALFELKAKTGCSAELMLCDLADLNSVEEFCARFLKRYKRLDVLVNNAGKLFLERCETKDGIESNFGVNFIGPFLLTNRLLPLLIKSAPARIINLTSIAHKHAKIRFDDINLEKRYNWFRGYAQSKLAIVMATYLLAKRLEGTGVTVNCIHPGIVGTDIIINRESGRGALLAKAQSMLFMTPVRGAEPVIRLASAQEAEGVTGRYYSRDKEKHSSRRSCDTALAEKLWKLSEEMCGLKVDKITGTVFKKTDLGV